MKKLLYTLTFCSSLFLTAQTAGVFLGEGEDNGKSFTIGSDASVETVKTIAKDYSSKDATALLSSYTKEFSDRAMDWSTKWLGSMETITMNPYMIIPVKMEGSENTMVLTWSTEDRDFKDGSKEDLDLMEIFTVDKDNKVTAFSQWVQRLETSNFGLNYGGKFIGDGTSEWSGRPLVFSNRGEVEAIETLVAAYNNRDAEACNAVFAEDAEFLDSEGNTMILTKELWQSMFTSFTELSWEVKSIVPLKIQNTDTESGVTVFSRERRVHADGTVWEKDLVEWFYFNKDGKIARATQYERSLPKE
ncbi:nuclear transport factor 2 family protein [Flavobacteriaceae bacterium]|nr:nuclear transport factor 2 family protein [Flavobacteriaceae bacterium]MDB9873946.1 nuclear transport factor 2 family protein [Flavobacteriaceae bacterium]